MWHAIESVFLDALLDTLKILPFLLIMHIIIEVIEYRAGNKVTANKVLSGPFSPLLSATVGLVPQCGFSVVATKLYAKKNIRAGTLLAVYIATSDEAIPILLSDASSAKKLVPLLIIKFIYAVVVGFAINWLFRKKAVVEYNPEQIHEAHKGCHGHEIGANKTVQDAIQKKFDYSRFILHPLVHTLTILGFIFIVNLVLGGIIHTIGEQKLESAMNGAKHAQPFLAALVGLIPNCAGSVVIARMYAVGGLTLGAAVAGLSVNAGIAFAVLLKENKNLKHNIAIIAGLYAASTLLGMAITLIA